MKGLIAFGTGMSLVLLAEIDAAGWAVIIGAVTLGILQVLNMRQQYLREQAKIARENLIADRVAAVAEKAAITADKVAVVAVKAEEAAVKLEEVHKATNSLVDRLVASTEAEALARGGADERARADKEKEKPSG